MSAPLEAIISAMISSREKPQSPLPIDLAPRFDGGRKDNGDIARSLNAAFLIALAGTMHPASERAHRYLAQMAASGGWDEVAAFYLRGIGHISREIDDVCEHNPQFALHLRNLTEWMSHKENLNDVGETAEKMWSVFFPEAQGILDHERQRVAALRKKRMVTVTQLNPSPITNPAREMLFTANVLLTIPSAHTSLHELPFSDELTERLSSIIQEPQIHFYDHPIQIGVEEEKNEMLYGLRALDSAFEFERHRGNMPRNARAQCVLSVSVTHSGLKDIAKSALDQVFARSGTFSTIDVYVITESDTQRIISEILAPAAKHYLERDDAGKLLEVFGVDGSYGRHYSFLKAVAPFWSILIQPEIKATFKIDLDQVFPQKELVDETGASAFEHFKSPLWGARGMDFRGEAVELGMIAGALVNEQDIGKSLFTPDVPFPGAPRSADEYIFFSTLPQALSTEAEMTTRYNQDILDGTRACIQRIHVTGGTTGILVESLRRHRPFTPSFIGRAEDQAYIFSTLPRPGTRLCYVHKDGLIMRHDKEAFAQEAIQSAYIAKLVSDYVRILLFSAYAETLTGDVKGLKDIIDPFTGCFVSAIPATVVYLRFALKAAALFAEQRVDQAVEFIKSGAKRIAEALDFTGGTHSMLARQYEKERLGWDLYYDTLTAIEAALKGDDLFAQGLHRKAREIIDVCILGSK
ncbi:MAG: hypothetical protein JRJ70_02355 [Deltaproteobacteria bacterium]|nr:hypothetical protein [Deltaproteobacteria bacterium]